MLRRRRRALAVVLATLAAVVALVVLLLVLVGDGDDGGAPEPDNARWSVFEDHASLIRSGPARRVAVLRELRALGADTLRVLAKWNELAPSPRSGDRPQFDAADPRDYRTFGRLDDLIRRADRMGFRILVTLAPDAPRWASEGNRPVSIETVNYRPDTDEFGRFAGAVARRYSGDFEDLPAVRWFSIWNEPNHQLFLKPGSDAPEIYRRMVKSGLAAVRENGASDARVLVGETAAVGQPENVIGPSRFVRRWLCLDDDFQPLRGEQARREGCQGFRGLAVDGYAHHPYGPALRVPAKQDVVSLLVIRRLGRYLDRAARAGRVPPRLPIYNTEFGLQSNPPDPTVSTSLAKQAALLNEKEEFSYRYPRLRSYSQYLLYDDPPREGVTEKQIWSGFQTGLRFTDGKVKPSWSAYRLPIVVREQGDGVVVWGRVRPGEGTRYVQLERRRDGRFERVGGRIRTNASGHFEVTLPEVASYRFRAFDARSTYFARSRTASPIAAR